MGSPIRKVTINQICPIRASIANPERNHMSQTRKTMSLTSKNFWLSLVRNMSHSGLTGWTIPTPHSLQHLNVGKREIQGPASGAEILASQKARVTRICPIRAPIALPDRNHMSQTRKTMSLTPKNSGCRRFRTCLTQVSLDGQSRSPMGSST